MEANDIENSFLRQLGEHRYLIERVCRLYAYTVEDRQDLFQEIVAQLWRAYPRFRAESKFSTWLYRIGINTAITRLRKKRPAAYPLTNESYPQVGYTITEDNDQLAILYQAIGKLNEIERSIVMLYLDDKSYSEMEEILGIGQAALRVRMNRIKEKIRTLTQKNS